MLYENSRQEIVKVIGEEQAAQIEEYVVEKNRQFYSDEELRAKLLELYGREIEIMQTLPFIYKWALSDSDDYQFWRWYWLKLIREREADEDLKQCYIWHLKMRGDESISKWIRECEEYRLENVLAWQQAAYGLTNKIE